MRYAQIRNAEPPALARFGVELFKPEFPIWTSSLCIVRFSRQGHNEFTTRVGNVGLNGI